MPVTWQVTPEQAMSQLADTQIETIHATVLAVAQHYAPIIQKYMNESIPWHHFGEADISPDEPNDMLAYVEEEVNRAVYIHLSHDYMLNPEPTLDDELAFVPPALDYWSPIVMRAVRSALGVP